MHLVGFIIRIYHDEQSPERQIRDSLYGKTVGYKLIVLDRCHALQSHIYRKHNVSAVFKFSYLIIYTSFNVLFWNASHVKNQTKIFKFGVR